MTLIDWHDIEQAARAILAGQIVAMPTETVYGLAGDATNDAAIAAIYAAKNRPHFNPLIAHMADLSMAMDYADFPPLALSLAEKFWPGGLTLVLPRTKNGSLSLLASAGLNTVALRCPDHPIAQALLKTVGRPLVAPSANPSGGISPTTADHVSHGLGEKVSIILDGGPCRIGIESTILKVTDEAAILLRPGAISREAIERTIGAPVLTLPPKPKEPKYPKEPTGKTSTNQTNPDLSPPLEAPGMMSSHYAPKAKMRLNAKTQKTGEVFLGFGALTGSNTAFNLSPSGDIETAAANLFKMLHQLDDHCSQQGLSTIAVAPIPSTGLGEAINDRLTRAAAPKP